MSKYRSFGLTILLALAATSGFSAEPLKVLLVDGQNNHNWKETSPLIVQVLEGTGQFAVDVATSPAKGGDMTSFQPAFSDYDVVVSNYNGQPWSEATRKAFEEYVSGGGGFVSVHAADNAFPGWEAYNRMIGLGGWGGRNEESGPYVRWQNGKIVRQADKGRGGSHGRRHPFLVVVRDTNHPITKGLPSSWMQAADELYAELRGPAENMHVLATAFSSPDTGGTDKHEPILMSVAYGDGRVFHTTLGHDNEAMKGVAFQVTLQRGTEWAATGKVTTPPVSEQTLTSEKAALRDPAEIGGKDTAAIDFDAPPALDAPGWVKIFNGKDLTGWSQKNGTATYRVTDGMIIGKTAVGSPNSFMCTDKEYEDFELTFEVNVDHGLNSGVQIRSRSLPDYKSGRVHGPQVEIESSPGESAYIYSEGTGRGWISPEQPIKNSYNKDKWNRFRVRAVGDRIQTWVNDKKIEDLEDEKSSHKGFFGLQVHGIGKEQGPYEVRWRDVQVRELK
ncbi:Trehalose utilization [Roseimaritima multifibrata]|uniref:Trehalose utilization n=1 Tax=Roseimaritima multifibrata TaxID=1930274 RepID=A0A517MD86_9BACT|nr:family 16 glycoside hydrolase [Roseimaritima multifibrata]QDS92849.1 Trehalose utilization [Roseimaritima multifibrata]